jgi:branched-chain amino acid transport system substrate-binding protein
VKTLKIGNLLCVTGWYSVFDAVEARDCKIVADMINEKGGITVQGQKYKIELVVEDGKSALDGISAGANRLVFDQKVKFVIGPTGFFSIGSSPIFEQNKVLHVSGFNTLQPGEMDATTPYGFLGFDCAIGTAIAAFKVMQKEYPAVKKVAIVMPDDGGIQTVGPRIKKMLADIGISVVGDIVGYPNEMEDFSPIAAKLNSLKDADAIYQQHGAPPHLGNIVKGLRELGNTKPYITQAAAHLNDIAAIAGKENAKNVITLMLTPHAQGNPALMDEVFDRGGKKGPIYLFNPNGLWVLAQIIQAANSLDPDVVKAKWESTKTVDTLFGPGTIGGTQTYGIANHAIGHPLPYQKLVNGEAVCGGWVDVGIIP